jgi:hypothetical protein
VVFNLFDADRDGILKGAELTHFLLAVASFKCSNVIHCPFDWKTILLTPEGSPTEQELMLPNGEQITRDSLRFWVEGQILHK